MCQYAPDEPQVLESNLTFGMIERRCVEFIDNASMKLKKLAAREVE